MKESGVGGAIYARLFRTRAAAAWLGISERQLLEFARAGVVGKKVGNIWLFSQQELAEFAGVPTNEPSWDR